MRATTGICLLGSVILPAVEILPAQTAVPLGTHRMVLASPGGELPFYLQQG